MGVMLSSCFSMSPCSKNSELTRSATRFSISQGFVMADKSQTVMLMARRRARGSSATQWLSGCCTLSRNGPRFLIISKCKMVKRFDTESSLNLLEIDRQICGQNGIFQHPDHPAVVVGGEVGQNLVAGTVQDHQALIEVMVLHGGG